MPELSLPVPSATKPTPAYAMVPPNAKRGVVVIHEIMGRQPEIDRVVDRFAAKNYAAIEPDLFADGLKPLCIQRAVRDIGRGEGPTIERIRAAREWLAKEAKLEPKSIGVVGFCLGGGFALALGGDFGAVSTNYGDIRMIHDELPPTIGCYGGRDLTFGKTGPKLDAELTKRGVPHEIHTFPTVGHSFLTDGHHPVLHALASPLMRIRYDAAVAEEAWTKIFAFFDKHLQPSSST